ncbi:MAG: hypothetical protein F4205_10665 [Gemmatimonadetes bacterium]|nr:hypothetical protein [Gemmatimonadota bacterium]MXX70566.1 hypothetical protein [Gemmatimonadota bacterium]MYC90382.1 hypothetical protein [Gemmatimonadota bacterium]MYG35948.1 hypothetical protein [Gemmatimonadota bacterium]
MDLRFIAVVMAIAVIMDMLGRMARKRAADQQGPPGEEWDMLKALAEGREPPGPAAEELRPARRGQQVAGGFELWSETPAGPGARDLVELKSVVEPSAPEPVIEPAAPEPVIRDRAARPIVVRSREPRPVEQRPEWADPQEELDVHTRPLPAPLPPERKLPTPTRRPASSPPAPRRWPRPRPAGTAGPEDALGLGTIGGLRKALVAREVLGPPIALRGEDGGPERR